MGFHSDVQTGLALLLENALQVPVLNGLTVSTEDVNRLATVVLVVRESIQFDPHEPIMPNPTETQQPEKWYWTLDVKGGGGTKTAANAGAEVDLLLEAVRTALAANRPTQDCGPLHLESEEYVGNSGSGVIYRQTWWHERF
jgi:hypothetical protein